MKTFLEEYGVALFAMICIVLLICIASPVSTMISDAIQSVVTSFSTSTSDAFDNVELPTFAAPAGE
jgi:hypothetical protein